MVLNAMRSKKFSRRVLVGLLLIIVPAFVFWGVGSISDRPKPAGKIFGRTISAQDFQDSLRGVRTHMILNFYGDYENLRPILRDQERMYSMAWERLLLLEGARDENIKVSDREVMAFVAGHPLFQRDGAFNSAIYSSVLGNPALSMSPRQFEEIVRENLMVMKFRNLLVDGIKVTQEEIEKKFSLLSDKVSFSYFMIGIDRYSGKVDVTEEEIASAYERNKDFLFSPEKAEAEYIEALFTSFDERTEIARALESARRELVTDTISLKEFAGREGFSYGRTDIFTEHSILEGLDRFPNFNETAFSLNETEISMPVFTQGAEGSAFIIKRTKEVLPRPLSYQDAREDLADAIKSVKKIELTKKEAENIYDRIERAEISFEKAAEITETTIKTTGPISAEDDIDGIISARELVFSALQNRERTLHGPIISREGVIMAEVKDIHKAPSSELTEEKREILERNILIDKRSSVIYEWIGKHSGGIEAENINRLREL